MKNWGLLLSVTIFSTSAPGVAAPSSQPRIIQAPGVIEQGPHHRKWQYTSLDDVGGQQVEQTHSYVELKSGMNRWSQPEGKWVETSDEIELFRNGAVARKAAHEVIFAPNVTDNNGTIDLLMPGNKRLRSRVFGIAYMEAETGKSVMIAEIKDRVGQLIGRNKITYPDAFDAIKADIRYVVSVGAFEQDILLKEQLPSPAAFGLDPAKTSVEVWTEFLQAPEPNKRGIVRQGRLAEDDEDLNFGPESMFFGRSKGFTTGGKKQNVPELDAPEAIMEIRKQWHRIDGKDFLIESAPFSEVERFSQGLPKGIAKIDPGFLPRMAAKAVRGVRTMPVHLAIAKETLSKPGAEPPIEVASIGHSTPTDEPALVLDYILAQGATDYTFRGNETYYVSGSAFYDGTTVFDGGTVIKYAPSAGTLYVSGSIVFRTSAYCPVTFTARDDNTVGGWVDGSTGNPSAGSYGGTYLYASGYIHDVRIRYAFTALYLVASANEVRNAEFSNCKYGVGGYSGTVNVRNVLFRSCDGYLLGSNANVIVENSTFDGLGGSIVSPYYTENSTFNLTNCLITRVQTTTGFSGSNNQILSGSGGVYQTVGGGNFYLADESPYRNAGTANINSQFLTDLKTRTTYPPIVITGISQDTILSPIVFRDTDALDLGYHYAPLDYVFGTIWITNSVSLVLTNGVVLGCTSQGLGLASAGARLISNGTANNVNRYVWAGTVQEAGGWGSYNIGLVNFDSSTGYTPAPEVQMRHTEMALFAGYHLSKYWSGPAIINFRDCRLWGGAFVANDNGTLTLDASNCLFSNTGFSIRGSAVTFYNNTFYGGNMWIDSRNGESYTFKDNLFDRTNVGNNQTGTWNSDYNGYVSGEYRITPNSDHDVILSSKPSYQGGASGLFYLPSGIALINAGSRSATSAGLYHHTVLTSQSKETNSTVDIGFHYVALNGSSQPVDSDDDGVPDYLEDVNGNGSVDYGEGIWNSATDLGQVFRVFITNPKRPFNIP